MGWTSRKNYEAMNRANDAHTKAREQEVQARLDGRSKAEIRRLERATVDAARVLNEAMRKR